eukprot:3216810-Alexandrium_andersonii.AAC.1
MTVYADADFADCATARRSTCGGAAARGAGVITHWSSTQKTRALSSGEAELAGIAEGAVEGMGLVSVAQDLGVDTELRARADS